MQKHKCIRNKSTLHYIFTFIKLINTFQEL